MNHILISVLLILSSVLLTNLAFYGMCKNKVPGMRFFSIVLAAMIIHTVGYAMELASTTLGQALFWIRIEYIGVAFYPLLIFLFARELTDEKKVANKYLLIFVGLINSVTLILVWTALDKGIYYQSFHMSLVKGYPLFIFVKGTWYYIQFTFLLIAMFYAELIMIIRLKSARGVYRTKILLSLMGITIPIVTTNAYVFGLGPADIDMTPFAFFLMSIFVILSLSRLDIFSFNPVTYEMIFHLIDEAVLIVDGQNHLLNCNHAAISMFPSLIRLKKGDSVNSAEELQGYSFEREESTFEIDQRILGVKISRHKSPNVRIFVFQDITTTEQIKKQLQKEAAVDILTGLYNRRYFMRRMEEQEQKEGTLVIIDIDFFKKINDTYGHAEGDRVLSTFASLLLQEFGRESCFRYGGDEFVLFLTETDPLHAGRQIEALKKKLSNIKGIAFSFSAGAARFRFGKLQEVFLEADQNLYRSKHSRRNL